MPEDDSVSKDVLAERMKQINDSIESIHDRLDRFQQSIGEVENEIYNLRTERLNNIEKKVKINKIRSQENEENIDDHEEDINKISRRSLYNTIVVSLLLVVLGLLARSIWDEFMKSITGSSVEGAGSFLVFFILFLFLEVKNEKLH